MTIPPLSTKEKTGSGQTFDYSQKILKEDLPDEPEIGKGRVLKWRIAVARFGDLKLPVGSPFDKPGHEVIVEGEDIEANPTDVEPCPAFTGALVQALIDSGRFIVIERKEINKLLREQEFGASGRVLPRTAAKLGKVRGVELTITGEVAAIKTKKEKMQVMALLRIYDVKTAEILTSGRVEADSTHAAVEMAAAKVIAALKDRSWTTKISAIRGNLVLLNAGERDGVHKGDRFTITALGDLILDPDEGTVLGREEKEAGLIEITEVKDKYCEAKPLKQDVQFRVGDRAEFIPGPYAQHDLE
jgi:hypothetical protein